MGQPLTSLKTTITHISWGRMEISVGGQRLEFKDCQVWPGGAKAWDWNVTGTHHHPGIQPADIEEILAQGVDVMVLSRGMELRLHTTLEAEEMLRQRGVEYHIEETQAAVALFNQLAEQGRRVGGIFHSTC